MRALLCRNWWAVAIRGVAALLFGILAIALPGVTLLTLVVLLSAYFAIDGIFAIVAGVRAARARERWWPFVLEGIVNIAVGVVIFLLPQISVLALMYLLAIWAIFTGVVMAFGGGTFTTGAPRWLLIVGGALSVLLGVMMIAQPSLGLLALAWWVGSYGIMFGVVLLSLALWLRNNQPSDIAGPASSPA
ncbi:MAG: HdeD family acid-resistance protein [Gemmatimonas sp.]